MYCPNCAAEASAEQKFCRGCGMELQAVAELIGAQTNIAKPERNKEAAFDQRQRAMLIWGFILTLGAAAVGAGLRILGRDNIHPAGEFTPYVIVIAVMIALFGMGLMCYPFLEIVSLHRRSHPSANSAKSEPTVKLQPALLAEEPPSVTENTTGILEAANRSRDPRDTA